MLQNKQKEIANPIMSVLHSENLELLVKYQYESIRGDSTDTTQHFIPFHVKIKLPKPRKFREIIQRDIKERIIKVSP